MGDDALPPHAQPLVSIVTPTLNRAALLEFTLRSVRSQSYRNIEHLVMDGGSTDSTLALLRRYEGTYDLRWNSEPDGGMYEAINRGLEAAKGEIVAYLNSDDLYFPWAVEAIVERFLGSPDADFVFGCGINVSDRDGRQVLVLQPPFDVDFVRRVGFLCQPTVFWRKRVFARMGGFDESLHFVADCDYWMRTGEHYRYVRLHEFVAIERNHEASLREAQREGLEEELWAVRRRYVKLQGLRHRFLVLRHKVWLTLWKRSQLFAFAALSLLPRSDRRWPWSQMLAHGGLHFRWRGVVLRLVPGLRSQEPILRPSRHWLDPPS